MEKLKKLLVTALTISMLYGCMLAANMMETNYAYRSGKCPLLEPELVNHVSKVAPLIKDGGVMDIKIKGKYLIYPGYPYAKTLKIQMKVIDMGEYYRIDYIAKEYSGRYIYSGTFWNPPPPTRTVKQFIPNRDKGKKS